MVLVVVMIFFIVGVRVSSNYKYRSDHVQAIAEVLYSQQSAHSRTSERAWVFFHGSAIWNLFQIYEDDVVKAIPKITRIDPSQQQIYW